MGKIVVVRIPLQMQELALHFYSSIEKQSSVKDGLKQIGTHVESYFSVGRDVSICAKHFSRKEALSPR